MVAIKTTLERHFIFLSKKSSMMKYIGIERKRIIEAMYQWDSAVSIEVVECNNQTITVKGVPFWFIQEHENYVVAGTDIKVLDYVGTPNIGLVYLSKPVLMKPGNYINLKLDYTI